MFYSPIQATCCLPSVSVTSGLHAGLPYIPHTVSSSPRVSMQCSQSPHLLTVQSPHFPTYPCSVHILLISSYFTVSISFSKVFMQCPQSWGCVQSPHLLTYPCSVHSLLISSRIHAVFTVSSSPQVSMQCSQAPHLLTVHSLLISPRIHAVFTVSSSLRVSIQLKKL